MNVENIIALVLFILPGIMAYKWVQLMSSLRNRDKGSIEFSALILVYAIPSVVVDLLIIEFITGSSKLTGIKDLTKAADSIEFLTIFLFISIFTSFGTACLDLKIVRPTINKLISFYRDTNAMSNIDSKPIWTKIFESNDVYIANIYSLSGEGKNTWGFIQSVSGNDEPRDLFLSGVGVAEILESKMKNKQADNAYVDIENQTVVKLYKCTEELINELNLHYQKNM